MSRYHFDELRAKRAVSFVETQCVHMKGEWAGKPLTLMDWQKEIVGNIFGWVDDQGMRRYQKVFLFMPRKNAKTTLIAALAHLLLFVDGEKGAEIYVAAADKEQARIAFAVCKHMVKENPVMRERSEVLKDTISLKDDPSFIRVISSDADTKHGYNAHGVIIDELHAHAKQDLTDVLVTSTGSRRQPLIMFMTTAGAGRSGVCWEEYQYAKKVRDGVITDDRYYPIIYEADPDDDPFNPDTWRKANPGLGVTIKESYIESSAHKAKTTPSFYNTFLQLHLNQWVNAQSAWISNEDFQKCNLAIIDPGQLAGRECYGGLDLASVSDTTGFVLEFPDEKTGITTILKWCWVPHDRAIDGTQKGEYDYLSQIRVGAMHSTPGNATDYEYVKRVILDCCDLYDVRQINYDSWNSSQLVIDLTGQGVPMNKFGQGYRSLSAPMKEIERLIMSEKINHGGDPVLSWQMSNVRVVRDPAGNIKPTKQDSKKKVDLVFAWIMAHGAYMAKDYNGPGDSIYNTRGIISI